MIQVGGLKIHTVEQRVTQQDLHQKTDALVKSYNDKNVDIMDLIEKKQAAYNLDFDSAYEEVIADSCMQFITDGTFVEKMSDYIKQNNKDANLLKRAIRNLPDKIKNWYKTLKGKNLTEEAQIVGSMRDNLQSLYDMWNEGIIKASENAKENTTHEGDVKQQARYAKQGGAFSNALTGAEWTKFYKAVIGDNQYANCLIGKTGVCFPGGNTLIVYNGNRTNPVIKAVYNLGDYEYNIHDGIDNVAEILIKTIEEDGYGTKQAEAVLQEYSTLYGTLFKKYNPQNEEFTNLTRESDTDRETDKQKPSGTGVSERVGEDRLKYSRRYSERDLFFDVDLFDDTDEDIMARHFVTNNEAIGEVLKNIDDFPVTPVKAKQIAKKCWMDITRTARRSIPCL